MYHGLNAVLTHTFAVAIGNTIILRMQTSETHMCITLQLEDTAEYDKSEK